MQHKTPAYKSETERQLGSYLRQRHIEFRYEPYGKDEKNPDFFILRNSKKGLVEIKDIQETPLDLATKSALTMGANVTFSLNPVDTFRLIRRKIDDACVQLKQHKDTVDFCVAIIGKRSGFLNDISLESIFYAMYGDIRLEFPIDPKNGNAIGEARSALSANGVLRKNRLHISGTKEMYSPHSYLSAVGIVEEFNGRQEYERDFYEQLKISKPTAEEYLKFISEEWEKHQNDVPILFQKDKILYRVRLIANPLSNKPLPKDIFNGEWDEVVYPTIGSA